MGEINMFRANCPVCQAVMVPSKVVAHVEKHHAEIDSGKLLAIADFVFRCGVLRCKTKKRLELNLNDLTYREIGLIDSLRKSGDLENKKSNPAYFDDRHKMPDKQKVKDKIKDKNIDQDASVVTTDQKAAIEPNQCEVIRSLDSYFNEYLKKELEISREYKRSDFDKLSGWHVSGGVPSLGKKR